MGDVYVPWMETHLKEAKMTPGLPQPGRPAPGAPQPGRTRVPQTNPRPMPSHSANCPRGYSGLTFFDQEVPWFDIRVWEDDSARWERFKSVPVTS